jgi:O-succinylbenzoate synthase
MSELSPPIERMSAWLIELPLQHRFTSAATSQTSRRVIIVRLESEGLEGWGETAPVPGHTVATAAAIWSQLRAGNESGMAGVVMLQARIDLEAKAAGEPLYRRLGGNGPVRASVAIGIGEDGQPDRRQLQRAVDDGYRFAKLKVGPATNPARLLQLASTFSSLSLGLDANGSLGLTQNAISEAVDIGRFSYLEQPGPPEDIAGHVRFSREMKTPIALDESLRTAADVRTAIEAEAGLVLNLKAGRFGTGEALRLARLARARNVPARVGGLLETGIGRAHSVALASCPEFGVVGDVAASESYFDDDLVHPSWRLSDGLLRPTESPGIGVEIDTNALAAAAKDHFTVDRK